MITLRQRRVALAAWWAGALFAFLVGIFLVVTMSAGGDAGAYTMTALVCLAVVTLPLWLLCYFLTGYFLAPPPRPFGRIKS